MAIIESLHEEHDTKDCSIEDGTNATFYIFVAIASMEHFKIEFDWDDGNLRKLNITNAERGISKEELESVFNNPNIIVQENKYKGREKRYQTYGLSNQGRLIFVIFAQRDNKIRYVTAWQVASKGRKGEDETP